MSARASNQHTPHALHTRGSRARRRLLTVPVAITALLCAASPAHAYIYWTQGNGNSGPIGRANLDGTGVRENFIIQASCRGVAVDGAHIYWTNTPGRNSVIGRANIDGTHVDRNFISVPGDANGIAVDRAHIYWTDDTGIGRANLNGTGVDPSFLKLVGAEAVAVDGSHIYWGDSKGLGRANLDGTAVDDGFVAASDVDGVAVDSAHIYWTNFGGLSTGSPPGTIGRANLDGTGTNPQFITGAHNPAGIAVDATHIYWANYGSGTIGRANLDGTATNQSFVRRAGPSDIAVDALESTGPPPTPPVKTGVYINCQNEFGANGFPTQALVPLQHPRRCVVFGQPESISTLYPLVRARWKGWGKATATVTATWDNPSPREGPPSPIRAKAFRIRRGCDGRRFYTRVSVPGFRHTTIVLQLSAACKLPPL
jgi:hypothetical protein